MARKAKEPSPQEILQELTAGLRKAVLTPTIHAYKPLPHQAKFHEATAKGKLFIGGNRSGKTVGGGAEVVKWLTGRHERQDIPKPPLRGRAVGVDFLQGVEKIILPEIKRWMPPSYLINDSWDDSYNKTTKTLTLTNGSFCEFMSYDQDVDKFAGTSRHFIWFDEEPPEDIFNENMLRLADVDGSWWMTMTPLIDMSWTFERLYEPGTKGMVDELFVIEVATEENTYVTETALERVLQGINKGEREARTKGTYINHTGLVYKGHFNPSEHILEDIIGSDEWPLYHDRWGHFAMLDHGYRNPTACLFGCYNEEGQIVIYHEIYQAEKLIAENAQDILQAKERLKLDFEYIVCDPTMMNREPIHGSSYAVQYAENGVYLSPGYHDVQPGIARVQSRFSRNMLYITRRCEKLLWEINRYRWDKFATSKIAQRRSQKETPIKKDDHALDALRYGVCSTPAMSGEVDMPMGNVLNLPRAGPIDYDWALQDDEASRVDDVFLGSEW